MPPPSTKHNLLTPKQMARAIQVSESSVKRWCDGGRISAETDEASDTPEAEDSIMAEEYCRVCGCLLEVRAIPRAPPPPLELGLYPEPSH